LDNRPRGRQLSSNFGAAINAREFTRFAAEENNAAGAGHGLAVMGDNSP
jgi:hypothetical protein